MQLLPQDIVVVLKLLISRRQTYAELGRNLSLSSSQAFRSVDRAELARLLEPPAIRPIGFVGLSPNRGNLKEFLIHGVKYAFPVHRGGLVRGMPTAHAGPPLHEFFGESFDPPPVWPDANGTTRGTEFSPLYKNAPQAAGRDLKLYELLALIDAIRDGRAREREIAVRELTSRIDAL
jgi:hypothetical protein